MILCKEVPQASKNQLSPSKEVYQAKLHEQPGTVLTANIFYQKKTGHPLMIGKKLDKAMSLTCVQQKLLLTLLLGLPVQKEFYCKKLLIYYQGLILTKAGHSMHYKEWALSRERLQAKSRSRLWIFPRVSVGSQTSHPNG